MKKGFTLMGATLKGSLKGFTLVELLVVIAIIAILASISFALYSNAQKQANDSERRSEIAAVAKSLEATFNYDNGFYINGLANDFPEMPTDPNDPTTKYCIATGDTSASPAKPDSWPDVDQCPPASVYEPISTTAFSEKRSWTVCAKLEAVSGSYFCKSSISR